MNAVLNIEVSRQKHLTAKRNLYQQRFQEVVLL